MADHTQKHSIGKTIADLRKAKGWTQAELAEKLNVSDKAVSKWEMDNGTPSIEFFPMLAELFGVSIDYLMTGKSPEKEVITMSKAEYCAKTDDVSLVKDINVNQTDEHNKTLLDYIIQYESVNVFTEIAPNHISKFDLMDALKMCLIADNLELMVGPAFKYTKRRNSSNRNDRVRYKFSSVYGVMLLMPEQSAKFFRGNEALDCILTDDFYEFVINDKRISDKTRSFLFGKQEKRECVWYHTFPYFIHRCYVDGNFKMLDDLLAKATESNNRGYEKIKGNNKIACNWFFINIDPTPNRVRLEDGHGFVRILPETIKLSLEKGDFDYFEKFSKINTKLVDVAAAFPKTVDNRQVQPYFNAYIASADEIRMAKLNQNPNVSKDEIAVQASIHDGVVNVDELLQVNDMKLIKKTIDKYPICTAERLYMLADNGQWRELFQWAIDRNNQNLADAAIIAVATGDLNWVNWEIAKYIPDVAVNKQYLQIRVNERTKTLGDIYKVPRYNDFENRKFDPSIKEKLFDFVKTCKTDIIEKNETISTFSKEYFEEELSEKNYEMVIIKLCVRLESMLRCNYHYEGDFAEMLDRYCKEQLTWKEDDGWGDMVERQNKHAIELLHKLRKQRNNIVHSEKNDNEQMTVAEVKECIDLICAIE